MARFLKRRRSASGRTVTRKATREEMRRLRKQTATQIRWQTTPRSQLVTAEVKEKRASVGFGFDAGGKYWR